MSELFLIFRGLNIDVIFTNLLKVYRDPGNLIIVLNFNEDDEKYYFEQLENDGIYKSSLQVAER